jgi:predicted MFS family arabinose efflux permease
VLTVSAGLFSLVYGFSHAETTSWTNRITLAFLISGAILLIAFAAIQSRSRNPLLPLRVVTDRNRAASFITIGVSGSAVFGVFLFLTYYLQQTRGYSPVATGIAFLPMTAAVMISAAVATNKLRARFGPRPLVMIGMALGAIGMLYLSRLGVDSSYVTAILPALIAIGIGLGLSMASAMNSATLGVNPADAGVASATVSASQQIGGSLGTALLSTIATSALTGVIAGAHGHISQTLMAHAAVHADTTAFVWAAAIFAIGAVIAGSLFDRGTKALQVDPGVAPALAH